MNGACSWWGGYGAGGAYCDNPVAIYNDDPAALQGGCAIEQVVWFEDYGGVVEEAGDGGENKWQHGKGSSTVATNDNMLPEGPVAQRSEQGTHNPLVQGSNPCGPSVRNCLGRRGAPKSAWHISVAP